jgi:hypothetical protein
VYKAGLNVCSEIKDIDNITTIDAKNFSLDATEKHFWTLIDLCVFAVARELRPDLFKIDVIPNHWVIQGDRDASNTMDNTHWAHNVFKELGKSLNGVGFIKEYCYTQVGFYPTSSGILNNPEFTIVTKEDLIRITRAVKPLWEKGDWVLILTDELANLKKHSHFRISGFDSMGLIEIERPGKLDYFISPGRLEKGEIKVFKCEEDLRDFMNGLRDTQIRNKMTYITFDAPWAGKDPYKDAKLIIVDKSDPVQEFVQRKRNKVKRTLNMTTFEEVTIKV